jgi:hypothetical protein
LFALLVASKHDVHGMNISSWIEPGVPRALEHLVAAFVRCSVIYCTPFLALRFWIENHPVRGWGIAQKEFCL